MKKHLIPESGQFYKANLHCHTTVSDGCRTPEEIKQIYRAKGYSVVAYTDHNVLISHNDLRSEDFLPLNGIEVDVDEAGDKHWRKIKRCHLCFIALEPNNLTMLFFTAANISLAMRKNIGRSCTMTKASRITKGNILTLASVT